jgi:hypothetical protein
MIRASVVAVLLFTFLSSAAPAQTKKANSAKGKKPEPGPPALINRASLLNLLRYPSVREELKLTPAQEQRINECKAKLDRFNEDARKRSEDFRKSWEARGLELDPQAQAAFNEEARAARRDFMRENDADLLKPLDRSQRTRLDQIGLQQEGSRAFLRPEFQERLNMDPGQIEAVRITVAEGNLQRNQARTLPPGLEEKVFLPPAPGEDPNVSKIDPKYREQYLSAYEKGAAAADKVSESMQRQITKLLSKKQRQVYQAMCGEPFDLASMRPTYSMKAKSKSEAKAP